VTVLRAAAVTDTGRRRQKNDDTPLVVEGRLFAVADGMGGYAGGDVASTTAVRVLEDAFIANPTAEGLEQGVIRAGNAVQEKSLSDPDLNQMGTTLSAIALVDSPDGEVFALAHIGDSRIYLLRDGELSRVGITGTALGLLDVAELRDAYVPLKPGDVLVLHTDGVTEARRGTEFLEDEGLERILHAADTTSATALADHIVERTVDFQDGMPRDDIAVVVLRVPG